MSGGENHVHTLVLTGPVTLEQSTRVSGLMRAALAEGKALRVDLGASGPWDLTGLQLLISLVATGREAGVTVRLAGVPGVCRATAERAGLGEWLQGVSEPR